VSALGGSGGSRQTAGASTTNVAGGNSGGCSVAGAKSRTTRWGAMLALGTVVAAKLRRLVGGDDQSS
jgi:hypothetical protein